ncbi:MAG: toll/interleukin-1 receptor domain-containing protein [Chloroflexi bacterium]|nr:toll/interleukin-1 receptor domain-containing protein [Chloroflexota bacterium]
MEKFLEERSKIPIPGGDVARVRLLAKEIALGLHKGFWDDFLAGNPRYGPNNENLRDFWGKRWKEHDFEHLVELLEFHGYVYVRDAFRLSGSTVELLEKVESFNVFISYRRLDSSAFALLVLARLKEHDLIPFVDMALEAGGSWHADLEERIKACDFFIILLGKDTLASDMTVKEIGWAVDAERTIIPVWHSGFDIGSDKWNAILAEVKDAIQQTNAIRVTDESAAHYDAAIRTLLTNRFGITP